MTDKSIPLYSLLNQCGCFLFSRKGAGMKLFEAVKEAVTARNAAEYYGKLIMLPELKMMIGIRYLLKRWKNTRLSNISWMCFSVVRWKIVQD